jgi:ParB family chromosome partitioning protein
LELDYAGYREYEDSPVKIAIAEIKIGDRKRKQMGDIDALAKSIDTVGLLHPIVINSENQLICGGRRIEACKKLGWKTVEVTVATSINDIERAELAELQENTCRKDLIPSEMVAKAKVVEPIEQKAAKQRLAVTSEKFSEVKPSDKGESRAKVAAAVGVSAPTLAKAKAVVEAAEAHPEHYGDLVEQMDKTGKVSPAHDEMVRRHVEDKAPPPPKGPTPAEKAKNDPERKWYENIHRIYVLFNSIRDLGGVTKLAKKWSKSGRDECEKALRKFAVQATELADELRDAA